MTGQLFYAIASAVIPVWAWLLTAISRQSRPTRHQRHARAWSRPRPTRLFIHGRHAPPRRQPGRHIQLTGGTA